MAKATMWLQRVSEAGDVENGPMLEEYWVVACDQHAEEQKYGARYPIDEANPANDPNLPFAEGDDECEDCIAISMGAFDDEEEPDDRPLPRGR